MIGVLSALIALKIIIANPVSFAVGRRPSIYSTVFDFGRKIEKKLSLGPTKLQLSLRVRQSRSVSHASAVALVHAFVTSRVDHCCSPLAVHSIWLNRSS